jgi:hypothetical protein
VRRRSLPFLVALTLAACATEQVEVVPANDDYLISTIGSKLALHVPKGELVPQTRDESGNRYPPHYFYLDDRARGLILSGWFETADRWAGVDDWLRQVTRSDAEKGLPPRMDLRVSKDRGADVVEYHLEGNFGGRTNCHLVAHWVDEGTWIEMHASLTAKLSLADNQAQLEQFFQSIRLQR